MRFKDTRNTVLEAVGKEEPVMTLKSIAQSYVFRCILFSCNRRKPTLVDRVARSIVNEAIRDLFHTHSTVTRFLAARKLGNLRLYGGKLGPFVVADSVRAAIAALEIATHMESSQLVKKEAERSLALISKNVA